MLNSLASSLSRHLLEPADWARARLAKHAGKNATVEMPMMTITLRIGSAGYLEPIEYLENPEVTIVLTPLAVALWMPDRQAAMREIRVEGDTEMAAAISYVAANLRWDFEEDLSRVVGDVVAHRIGSGVRRMASWPRTAADSFAHNAAEYFSEETHLLATPLQAAGFVKSVDDLRDAVERLDKRIDRLDQMLADSRQD